jgi:di/tricarboxylate transporter
VTPKRRSASALAALLVVVALGVTSTLTPREAFSGFASSTVVTIVAFFILAEALRSTGMTDPIMLLLPIFWPWPPVNYPGGNRV